MQIIQRRLIQIDQARVVAFERLPGFIQGQTLAAVFSQAKTLVRGLVFRRIVHLAQLPLDHGEFTQGGIQAAYHGLAISVIFQIMLHQRLFHRHDKFGAAAGTDRIDIGQEHLPEFGHRLRGGGLPVSFDRPGPHPQQVYYVFYSFQLPLQPAGAVGFISIGGIKTRTPDEVGAIPELQE